MFCACDYRKIDPYWRVLRHIKMHVHFTENFTYRDLSYGYTWKYLQNMGTTLFIASLLATAKQT